MHAHAAYRKQQTIAPARIDVILGLYARALDQLDAAEKAIVAGDRLAAQTAAGQVQMIVAAFGAELSVDDPLAVTFLRVYEFVASRMADVTVDNLRAAAKVLRPLQEGFQTVREEALRLEREGQLPPLDQRPTLLATA